MTTAVTSLARSVLDPAAVCRTLSASVTGTHQLVVDSVNNTIRRTKEAANRTRAVAIGTVRLATRPFVWPINLSLDLSRRVTIQVLITLGEVLVTLNDLVTSLEKQLAEQERRNIKGNLLALEAPPSHDTVQDQDERHPTPALPAPQDTCAEEGVEVSEGAGDQEGGLVHRDPARDPWRRHLATSRKLKEENNTLKRRVRVTENKYEVMNSQIIALKELYRDKLSDMEYDLNDLKQQRHHVISMIQSAQTLANDCHGDVQTLMEELHELTSAHTEDQHSIADSLSLDLGLEGLTLTSQQRLWQDGNDSDTGYVEDSESDKSLTLRRVLHRTRHHDPLSATSSVTSLYDVTSRESLTEGQTPRTS